MGIITYLFHRSEGLTPQRFHMFFLDVGENIHFHYRDLRIELSTGEFEELADGFARYAPPVLAMIRDQGYRDGVLPNTNAPDTVHTFWDKGRLAHPVKYHPQRLSIEENVDGFHIHFRNYKLLLDRESFAEFARAMGHALLQLEDRLPADPVHMLAINDLAPRVLARSRQDGREAIDVQVDPAHLGKAAQVLAGLGYVRQEADGMFAKGDQHLRLFDTAPALPGPGGLVDLPAYIDRHAPGLNADELNRLKLRLLYLFKRAEAGHIPAFALEDVLVDSAAGNLSVDLFRHPDAVDPVAEYARLSQLFSRRRLFFVKPAKTPYPPAERAELEAALERYIRERIACHPCVHRVWLLGSSTRDRSGRYHVPFVHFDWVKLASDFDLLIELEPDHEDALPAGWEQKFTWVQNGCVYSHLGDLGQGMESEEARHFPGVRFYEHLLETYLYFPSRCHRAVKDDYLARIGARMVFERPGLIDWFEARYPQRIDTLRRVRAASYNKVYDLACADGRYALKVYVARHAADKDGRRLAYELALTRQLAGLGLDVPAPVANAAGTLFSEHPEGRAVLFQYVDGRYRHEPGEPDAFLAGRLLARIHFYSDHLEMPADPPRLANTLLYWLNAYRDYQAKGVLPPAPDLDRHIAAVQGAAAHAVHSHGDVSPRNHLYRDGRCWLIDFQNAGLGPATLDLADGMIEFAARGRHFHGNVMAAFLTGYQSIRPLDAAEKAELERLLPAQLLAKQARLARGGEHGYAGNTELIGGLQKGLELLAGPPADSVGGKRSFGAAKSAAPSAE